MSHHCWMCQCKLTSEEHRVIDLEELKDFISTHTTPTPFMYTWILNATTGTPMVCIPCSNWKRRCLSGTMTRHKTYINKTTPPIYKKFQKPLMQMDQLIMFMFHPGRYHVPDKRCIERLMQSLNDDTNVLQMIIPAKLRKMVATCQGSTEHDLVRAWWQYNNYTHFMSHPGNSRMVRGMLKFDEKFLDIEI